MSDSFDITLTWNADALQPGAAAVQDAASIFAAIQEQLGLRLEPIIAPIETIVIDHAARPEAD